MTHASCSQNDASIYACSHFNTQDAIAYELQGIKLPVFVAFTILYSVPEGKML